jgi:general secretion pathway protein D
MNPHTLRSRLLATVLGAVLMSPVVAQNDDVVFTLNFQEETDIIQIIEVVAEVTGRRILPDPRVRGLQVRLFNRDPMSADQIWQVFLEILQTNQLTAIESAAGTWRIVPDQNMRTEASSIRQGFGAEIVTRYITTDNVSAATLVPVLRPMMSTAAQLGSVPGTNTLILVDRADNLDRIVQIVQGIDRFNSQDIDIVTLQFAAAEDVAQRLTQLVQARSANGALAGLQVIPDERTNRVVLLGTASQLETYRAVAEELDRPATQGGGSQVRYLNYADAEEMAANLQGQFGGAQVLVDAETAADPTGGNVTVWADISTNSLVLAAPSSVMRDMTTIIDALDVPRAQVHVQAIIVEMSENRAAQLGLTWLADGGGGDQAAALTNFSAVGGGILQLAQIGAGGTPDPSSIPDGITAAIGNLSDSGTSWAAVVQALAADGDTNVLQFPEVVVLDNAEATLHVGQDVPFLTGQYATTGAGGGGTINPFSTVERQQVGTTLTITPRINEGTGMRLQISQEISSLSSSTVATDVITNSRNIDTEVFVNDGDILVLGGLVDDQLRATEQGIPGLRRIPGLKWLFRARNSERTKSNLMVFIRPTILRNSLDAGRLTGQRYDYMLDEQGDRAGEAVPLLRNVERPILPPRENQSPTDSVAEDE